MKSFAFIVNPITIEQLKNFWPAIKFVPDFILRLSIKKLVPFKVLHIKKVKSIRGKEIEGYIIIAPLLSRQLSNLEENFVLDKIIYAGHIAEDLGASVIGLNGHASGIADKGYKTVTRNLKIPVTSGNALGAWSVFEGVYRMAKAKKLNLKNSTAVVIGAGNSIGSLSARKLSDYVNRIIIVTTQRDKSEHLKEKILQQNPIEVIIEEDIHKAIKDADIVINANNSSQAAFDIRELKPNTVICNIFTSNNRLNKAKLPDYISIINAGLIKLPYPDRLGINTGLPKGIIYSSMAETMLLTFEERFISYSLGEDINLDKLEEIADISVRYGFEVWVPEAPVL